MSGKGIVFSYFSHPHPPLRSLKTRVDLSNQLPLACTCAFVCVRVYVSVCLLGRPGMGAGAWWDVVVHPSVARRRSPSTAETVQCSGGTRKSSKRDRLSWLPRRCGGTWSARRCSLRRRCVACACVRAKWRTFSQWRARAHARGVISKARTWCVGVHLPAVGVALLGRWLTSGVD